MPVAHCLICDAALPPERAGERYCTAHQHVYENRQVHGVSAPELDARYGDTLATWRDHPAPVADLPAAQLRFRHREGGWLLFRLTTKRAGGLSGQGYRTDWLAIRAATGEVRRYAHVPEIEVWLDLLGRRAVPDEENPVEQWGQPDPVIVRPSDRLPANARGGFRKLGPAPPPRAPDLRAVAATTVVPVYGLPAPTPGLTLTIANVQNRQGRDEIVGLTFTNQGTAPPDPERTEEAIGTVRRRLMEEAHAWREQHARGPNWVSAWISAVLHTPVHSTPLPPPPPAPPVPTAVLEVDSSYQLSYDRAFAPRDGYFHTDQIGPTLLAGLPAAVRAVLPEARCQDHLIRVRPLLWHYAPDYVAAIAASPARVLRQTLVIAGKPFAAELLAWTGPQPLCSFRLEREAVASIGLLLSGAAYGIAATTLLTLLERLVVVNNQPELLGQYQADLEDQLRP